MEPKIHYRVRKSPQLVPEKYTIDVKSSLCLINWAPRHEDVVLDGVVSFTLQMLDSRPPLDRGFCESQGLYGHCRRERNLLPLPGIEPRLSSP
jgi:hypothetical protein